ncbi:hypothetical protein, partial [Cyanobium sp. Copco_Reservoir_LC18]|uniref:hypothetical protein n=1 Tax=Cyanobium sp. Copco_Reservoir_LC18 TaxID=1328305 RepID=UPI001F25837F
GGGGAGTSWRPTMSDLSPTADAIHSACFGQLRTRPWFRSEITDPAAAGLRALANSKDLLRGSSDGDGLFIRQADILAIADELEAWGNE